VSRRVCNTIVVSVLLISLFFVFDLLNLPDHVSLRAAPPVADIDDNAAGGQDVGYCARKTNSYERCLDCCNAKFPNADHQALYVLCRSRCQDRFL
jgi:hypothetical protein